MSSIFAILLELLFTAATSLFTSYAIVGTVWAVGYPLSGRTWRFPRRAAMTVWLLFFLAGTFGDLPKFVEAGNSEAQQRQVQALNLIQQRALGGELSPEQVRSAVADVDLTDWATTTPEVVLTALVLKTDRYMDLHQSFSRGEVVRTPIPSLDRDSAASLEAADTKWTPLLEAAAGGGPVTMAPDLVYGADEVHLQSLMAGWVRYELLSAIEELHDVPVPLTEADRTIGPSLRWLPYAASAGEMDGQGVDAFTLLAAASELFDVSVPLQQSVLDSVRGAFATDARMTDAMVEYMYQVRSADLDTSIAVARHALLGDATADWGTINARRRLLGLPAIDPLVDPNEAARSARFPWQVDLAYQPIDERMMNLIDAMAAELRVRKEQVDESFGSF